jgi:hypothetical protein
MLIKFFRNGQGGGAGPVGYLVAREVRAYDENRNVMRDADGRALMVERDPLPEVLRGNAERMESLIDTCPHQWSYRAGVLSFAAEDAPTERQQQITMDAFEELAFAGLEPDQHEILWVRHTHERRVELHFLTPRMELERGRSLNIAPPGYQRAYDALRDVLNKEHGWSDPEAPERARDVRSIIEEVRRGEAREKLHDWLLDRIADGDVHDRSTMVETLRDAGFDVSRTGKNYLTVRDPETDERFRLKGDIFREDWTRTATLERAVGRENGERDRAGNSGSRLAGIEPGELQERLRGHIEKRARYHRQRYGSERERLPQREPENPERDHGRPANDPAADAVRSLGGDDLPGARDREHLRRELLVGPDDDSRGHDHELSADRAENTLHRDRPDPDLGRGAAELERMPGGREVGAVSDSQGAGIDHRQRHDDQQRQTRGVADAAARNGFTEPARQTTGRTGADRAGARITRLRRAVDTSLRNLSGAVQRLGATLDRHDRDTAESLGRWRQIADRLTDIVGRGVDRLRGGIAGFRDRAATLGREQADTGERRTALERQAGGIDRRHDLAAAGRSHAVNTAPTHSHQPSRVPATRAPGLTRAGPSR